jgi:hypothetical protein
VYALTAAELRHLFFHLHAKPMDSDTKDAVETLHPTVAKILLMNRCNIKLHAYFLPGQPRRMEFIVGSVLDSAVEMGQSQMDKGLMDHLIENFLQR